MPVGQSRSQLDDTQRIESPRPLPGLPTSRVPTETVPSRTPAVTPFADVTTADEDRLQRAHLGDLETQLQRAVETAQENENQREDEFRRNEEDRQRIFIQNEGRRDHQATEARNALLDLQSGLPLPERPPPPVDIGDGEVQSDRVSVASQHASAISEIIREERVAAAEERARLAAEAEAERTRVAEMQAARIRDLEEEVEKLRAELEAERQQRGIEQAEIRERERQEFVERDENLRDQLGGITNLIHEQRGALEDKKLLMDQRWEEKRARRLEKDEKCNELRDMVQKLFEDFAAERARNEDARQLAESRPGEKTFASPG